MTTITAGFDFGNQSDEQLREVFELWAPDNAPSAQWAELYSDGREAIVAEAHRRALGVHKWSIDLVCYAKDSSSGVSWGDYVSFVGTVAEFMQEYGLKITNRPAAKTGEAVVWSPNNERVQMAWVQE